MTVKKISLILALMMTLLAAGAARAASIAEIEADPMFAIREGWAWPVIVVPPTEGWDSPVGESIKYAMRVAERAISRERGAIRGKEVVFLFAGEFDKSQTASRVEQWRRLGACAIISFADDETNGVLQSICRSAGPSVVFCAGEHIRVLDTDTRQPYRYLFALDFSYFARANAIAEADTLFDTPRRTAVITDAMSARLAHGAALNVRFLRARGVDTVDIAVPAFRQDHFLPQVRDLESGGVRAFSIWLDAMATLSIWRTANLSHKGSVVYYCGVQHPILLDADGLMIVDKDSPLVRNEAGIAEMIAIMLDEFNRVPADPVMAAKAYALANWVLSAYRSVNDVTTPIIADALAVVKDIPLMDDMISIDPRTHRPVTRKYGILRVAEREYRSNGIVEIFSEEVDEIFD